MNIFWETDKNSGLASSKKTSEKKQKPRFSLETLTLILVTCVKSSQSSLDMWRRCKDFGDSHVNSSLCLATWMAFSFPDKSTVSQVHLFLWKESFTEKKAHELFRDLLYRKQSSRAWDATVVITNTEPSSLDVHPQAYPVPSLPSILENGLAAKFITNSIKLT